MTGALNVPGYSPYTYRVDGAFPNGSKWGTPTNGALKSGSTATQASILWDEGPAKGKAVYEVNADYKWDLDVTVVQVKLASGASNKLIYGSSLGQVFPELKLIHSSTSGVAMEAHLTIEKVIGPSVFGATRGEQFIEMGFIQNGKLTRRHALYDGLTPRKRVRNSLENGIMNLDYYTIAPKTSTSPWYDSANATGDGHHQVAHGGMTNHPFEIADTPRINATDKMSLTIGGLTDVVDKFAIEFDFDLYFAVRTIQDVNGSKDVFTQRGKASWEFDGSGDVDASGIWTQTGNGNTGDASFTEIKNGDWVPVTTGTPINTLFKSDTWTTENQ